MVAFLLFAEGAKDPRRVDLVAAGYRRHVRLEPEELSRLVPAMRSRAVILDSRSFCLGRKPLAAAARGAAEARAVAAAAGARAVSALDARS